MFHRQRIPFHQDYLSLQEHQLDQEVQEDQEDLKKVLILSKQ